ncbi:hypothetical protein Cadr_000028533 [Camelus dromedarius]|uniref:Uncharacterized protein n=1 Tax=Camelus dromedarius TaxID=9838 RepID=A0A5N4CHS2_CAMDR|nr:hypothetical protein Cadr_000028533 [Camelus dromedarius]
MEKEKGEHVEDSQDRSESERNGNRNKQMTTIQREPQRKHGEENGFCEKFCVESAAPENKIRGNTKQRKKKNREM